MDIKEAIEKLQREKVMSCHDCTRPMEVGWCENKCKLPEAYSMAIEALEKQGKYRWHDLRKDPDDLPKERKHYFIYIKRWSNVVDDWVEDYVVKSYGLVYKDWFDVWLGEKPTEVIAWKEIEIFEESEI